MRAVVIALFALMLVATPVQAGEWFTWDKQNTTLQVPITVLYFIDYKQASKAIDNPNEYYEINPALDKYPTQQDLLEYAVFSVGMTTLVTWLLPIEYSVPWQYGVGTIKFMAVANNMYVGLGLGF